MTIRSFAELKSQYDPKDLDEDDMLERENKLVSSQFSVILEGDLLELESALQWAKLNLVLEHVDYLFYGKIAYDYGFFELFFKEKEQMQKISEEISNIYTLFPNGKRMRSLSHDNYITKA